MRDTKREAETSAEGDAGSMQGACRGTPSKVSRIMHWAEGGTKPLTTRAVPQISFKWKLLCMEDKDESKKLCRYVKQSRE